MATTVNFGGFGNSDPTQGLSTPRLPTEGPGTTARPSVASQYYAPVPGIGNPALGIPSYDTALRFFQGQMAPQYAQIDLQQAQARNNIAQLQAQYQQAVNFGNQNKGLIDRGYGLGLNSVEIDRGAAIRDVDYYQDLMNKTGAFKQQDWDYWNKLLTLAGDLFMVNKMATESTYNFENSKEMGASAARGGFSSMGTASTLGELKNQYNAAQSRYSLGYDKEKTQLEHSRDESQGGFDEKWLGLQRQREMSRDQLDQLDIKAQELGLQRDQAFLQIEQGLQQMGLGNTIKVGDLMTAISSGDINKAIVGQQVLQAATQIAGPPPPPPNQAYQPGGGAYVKRGKAF